MCLTKSIHILYNVLDKTNEKKIEETLIESLKDRLQKYIINIRPVEPVIQDADQAIVYMYPRL